MSDSFLAERPPGLCGFRFIMSFCPKKWPNPGQNSRDPTHLAPGGGELAAMKQNSILSTLRETNEFSRRDPVRAACSLQTDRIPLSTRWASSRDALQVPGCLTTYEFSLFFFQVVGWPEAKGSEQKWRLASLDQIGWNMIKLAQIDFPKYELQTILHTQHSGGIWQSSGRPVSLVYPRGHCPVRFQWVGLQRKSTKGSSLDSGPPIDPFWVTSYSEVNQIVFPCESNMDETSSCLSNMFIRSF